MDKYGTRRKTLAFTFSLTTWFLDEPYAPYTLVEKQEYFGGSVCSLRSRYTGWPLHCIMAPIKKKCKLGAKVIWNYSGTSQANCRCVLYLHDIVDIVLVQVLKQWYVLFVLLYSVQMYFYVNAQCYSWCNYRKSITNNKYYLPWVSTSMDLSE